MMEPYEHWPETEGIMTVEWGEYDGGTVGILHGISGGAAITIAVDHRPYQDIAAALAVGETPEVAYEPWQVLRRRNPE